MFFLSFLFYLLLIFFGFDLGAFLVVCCYFFFWGGGGVVVHVTVKIKFHFSFQCNFMKLHFTSGSRFASTANMAVFFEVSIVKLKTDVN